MGQTVKLRRSAVSGRVPINSQLQLGELSVNTADGKLFFAKSGSLGPSIEEIITTNTQNTGSIDLVGALTASVVSSSFIGDGSELYNIPASGVVGLSLDQISSDGAVAAITAEQLDINVNTVIDGSLTATEITGSGLGLTNVPVNISGSSHTSTNYNGLFTKIHFDESTGIKVEGDTSTGIAKIYLDGVASEGGESGVGSTKFIEVTSPSSTWTFNHGLGEKYPSIMVFDSNNNVIIPQNIEAVSTTQLVVSFASPQIGYVTATVGGGLPTTTASDNKTLVTLSGVPTWKEGILSGSVSFNSFSSSIDTIIGSLETESSSIRGDFNAHTLSLNTYTSSNNSIVVDLVSETGSYQLKSNFNSYTSSISEINTTQNARIGSLEGFTASIDDTYATDSDLNTYTTSNDIRVDSIESKTGSFLIDSDLSTLEGQVGSLEIESGSVRSTLNTYTSSNDGRVDSIESQTGSYLIDSDLSTLEGQVGSLETESGSVRSALNTYTSSNDSRVEELVDFKDDTETAIELTGSNVTIKGNLLVKGTETRVNSTTVEVSDNVISLNGSGAANGGIEVRDVTSPGILSGSLIWDGTDNKWKAGVKGSEDGLVLEGDLNTFTSSNDGRLDSLETSTSSLNSFTSSINTTIKSKLNTEGVISGSIQIDHDSTTNFVANEHIDHSSITIGSGKGLSGGGSIDTSRSLTLDTGSVHFLDGVKSKLNTETVVSGSVQIDITGTTNYNLVDGRLDSLESNSGSYLTEYNDEYTTGATFNSTNGVITYTRNDGDTFTVDIDGRYLTSFTETDPVFTASPSAGITDTNISNWNAAYTYSTVGHLPLSGGTMTGNITLNDSIFLRLGNDTSIYSDGADSYIQTSQGDLYFYQGGDDKDIVFLSDNGSGGVTEYFRLDGSIKRSVFSQNVGFEDNVRSIYGSGNDLQIYHDGSNSYITDSGTGHLRIRSTSLRLENTDSSNMVVANGGGSVAIYYNGSAKFSTTNTGVSVTGIITATGGTSTNWNTAYGWGDHSTEGYITGYSEVDTLDSVTDRGAITTNDVTTGKHVISKQTNTTGTSGTTFLEIYNNVGSDISQQQSFIDFKFTDTNANFTPQVRIGAQVGRDADASAMSKEGAGAFVVYTGDGTDESGGGTLTESFRVSYNGNATAQGIITATGGTSTNWNTAYGWGNHASVGYITGFTNTNEFTTGATFNSGNGVVTFTRNNGGDTFTVDLDGRYLTSFTETDPVFTASPSAGITDTNIENWNTAYGWGDHSLEGYLTSYNDEYTTGVTWTAGTATLTFTRNDGDTYDVQMLETLTDVTVTGGTYASGTQILTLTKNDGSTVDVSGFAIDTDVNWYTTGATFNTGNGVITGTRSDGGTWTVDIDNRYLPLAGGTLTGDLTIDNNIPRIDFKPDSSGSNVGGRIEMNENGNLWVNAQGGKDLWLNWYSPTSPSSKADLQVGDGNEGSSILTVQGATRRVGINKTGPTQALDVSGNIVASGTVTASGGNSGNWNTAYGWGNHASAGYITGYSEVDTLATVTSRGSSTTNDISVGDFLATHQSGDDATTKAEMLSYAVAKFRPHSTNSGTLAIAQVDGGNSVGLQFTNGAGSSNWDMSLQPFGGNVGINKVNPSGALHVYSGTSERFLVSGDVHVQGSTDLNINGTSRRLSFTSGTGTIRTTTANNLLLQTNSTTALTIDTNQNVSIVGTLSASGYNKTSWDTAYGWGDHSQVGYITGFTNTNEFTTGATFNTGNGIITFKRNNGGDTYTVDLDGRYSELNHNHDTQYLENSYGDVDMDTYDGDKSLLLGRNLGGWSSGTKPSGTHNGFGILHVTTHVGGYATQFGFDTNQNKIWVRSKNPTSWGSWKYMWTEQDFTSTNISNWNTAYGWGDHSQVGYITGFTETDPVFTASPSAGITDTNISNWNTAYGWGDHSQAGYTGDQDLSGYLLNTTDTFSGNLTFIGGNNNSKESFINVKRGSGAGLWLKFQTDSTTANNVSQFVIRRSTDNVDLLSINASSGNLTVPGTLSASGYNDGNWDTAYGWGDHSLEGYLTSYSETDTLSTVTARGRRTHSNGSAVWDVTTPGLGEGNIHLMSVNTDHAGGAITFNSSDANSAQAGIYVKSDGSYGTKMYIATTDSYATGSKTAISIDHNGLVNITRGNNRLQVNGNRVHHAGDFTTTDVANGVTAYGWGDHSLAGYTGDQDLSGYATETYVGTQIDNLIASAPGTLDTLNELAAALGDDPNFATTITTSIATKLPLAGGVMSGNIGRSAHNKGYLVGGYNNIGASATATNPIFTIGTSYLPAVTTLGNMYGIGYTRGDASFMGIASGSGWGMYVAADGDARIWFDGSNGDIVASGTLSASGYNDSSWNTAWGWGDHSQAGYLTSSSTQSKYLRTDVDDTIESGSIISFKTAAGTTRGYLQSTDTNDEHFIIATSGGEDIAFKDGGVAGTTNMIIRGDGNVIVTGTLSASGYNDGNWNTAYGWGDHNGVYLPIGGKAADSDKLDGINSTSFLRSDAADEATQLTVNTLIIGSSAKIQFQNNDFIRYDDANGVGRFHFDSDGGTNNASVQASTFVGALSGNATTATTASNSNLLDNLDSTQFLRSDTADSFTGTITMGTQKALVANNYGRGVYGLYSSTRYQHVWSMGTAYNLSDDGTTSGNLYGLSFTHTNVGGQSKSGLGHQMLIMENGVTTSAIGRGIWTNGTITTTSHGTSANWKAAYTYSQVGHLTSSSTLNASNMTTGTLPDVFSNSTRYNIGFIDGSGSQSRDKIRVWDSSEYTIGMKSSYSYGSLGTGGDGYAMSFQMSSTVGRGFWWGDSSHSDAQGAMSLTTEGILTVAKSLSIGQGETITTPSTTPLYVEGTVAGSTVFDVQGTQGQLFSITDDLTGDLFSVSDISGIPIITVNSLGVVTIDDTLRVTGDVIAYSSSDSRLKDNVTPITNPLDKLKMIGGYEFDWNGLSKNNGHDVGVIAQEIESVLPELVETRGDGFKGVQYDKLTALLIEAVKEQQIQIDELKSKLNK